MPFTPVPYAAPTIYNPQSGGDRVIDLMLRQGQIAGQGAAAQGQIWGPTIANLGQQAAQYVQQRQDEKAKQEAAQKQQELDQRQADAVNQAVTTWDGKDPIALVKGLTPYMPIDKATKIAEGLTSALKLHAGLQQEGGLKPEEALKALPSVAQGFLAAPDALKPGWYASAHDLFKRAGIAQPGMMPDVYDKSVDPIIASFAPKEKDVKDTAREAEQSAANAAWTVDKGKPPANASEEASALGAYRAKIAAPTAQMHVSLQPPKEEALVKVEHQDPDTGKTVIEYLPKSELKGKTFAKGLSGTVENRLSSAQAVQQTGQDLISKLQDPKFAAQIGPVMGKFNTLQDFLGNPPPEYSEMAGQIESYALANMGVHGMRSAQGAEQIKKLLGQKHTPESLIAAIKGLNSFSEHFMANSGIPVSGSVAGKVSKEYTFNPATGKLE